MTTKFVEISEIGVELWKIEVLKFSSQSFYYGEGYRDIQLLRKLFLVVVLKSRAQNVDPFG